MDQDHVYSTHSAWCLKYPQCNLMPLSDITGGSLSDYMQIPRELQMVLHYYFHIM